MTTLHESGLHCVLKRERAEMEPRVAEIRRLEERIGPAGEDSGALSSARACVNRLIADPALLTTATDQENAENETLATSTLELEGAFATMTERYTLLCELCGP